MDFEKSFKRLDKIISELENKDLTVDKLVSLFDEANKLSEKCKIELNEAKQKIQTIVNKNNNINIKE